MVIIQNLHNIQKQTLHPNISKFYWCLLLFFVTQFSFGQDSIVLESSVSEKKLIQFEEHFFEAITQKAIDNYQNAIDNLEECNILLPNNKAVLFELSKNYYYLNKLPEALLYAQEALNLEKDNLWMLEHLVKIHKKNRNFDEAIIVQQRIAEKHPKKKRALVFLYLQNDNREGAIKILDQLAEAKMLDSRLRTIRKSMLLVKTKPPRPLRQAPKTNGTKEDLKLLFEQKKSFKVLTELLDELDKENNTLLLNYSERGMSLFPAQPIVYLMNGKALNKNKQFKKAIESLQNGIDFVIDDKSLENRFYNELIKAYKALGDSKNVNKYQKKRK
ncbi:tetratricopeptide repeat protein [Tenacibaculum sp. MEBiC06402]|uniref:tetratricopeptide repeat protein n=1 Tax=unclassified Tenacibaculum TaxID=2635139 RepID=UPI003B9CB86F